MAKHRHTKKRRISRWVKDHRDLLKRVDFRPVPYSDRHWRDSAENLTWKKQIRQRDGNKCVSCGSTSHLEVHHKIPVSVAYELRFEVFNGECLCRQCHRMDHMHQHDVRFWKRMVHGR